MDKLDCDYMDKLCHARHDAIAIRLKAMDDALLLKANQLEQRLEALNELRRQVVEDREVFLRKEVYDFKTQYYDRFIESTLQRITVIETRHVVTTAAIASGFVILQVALHFLLK